MIIHMKNKYQLALVKLIQECKEKGGIPDYIEVDPNEAWGILKEINRFQFDKDFDERWMEETKSLFRLKMNKSGIEDVRFIVHSDKVYDYDVASELVKSWWRKEFSVSLHKPSLTGNGEIELRVHAVHPKKVEVKTENEDKAKDTPKTHLKAKHYDPKTEEVDKDPQE